MYCVLKVLVPANWRMVENCSACGADEYCAASAPGPDWKWDSVTGEHRPPTAAELLAAAKVAKKAEVRTWLAAINGRAYMHAGNADDFDDLIADLRTAIRGMINNFAAEITPAIAARVSAAEAKAAFTAAAPTFDLIAKAKEARTLMNGQIEDLTTAADVQAYVVDDAKAGTVHAAANPTASPTLTALLVQFPVRV